MATEVIDLPIDGMTCGACAARVERKLNALDGVEASVNFATHRATVAFDPAGMDTGTLVAAVEAAGYRAHAPAVDRDVRDRLGLRLAIALTLAAPVTALSMIPALQFDAWQWVALALATPVVTWCAWPIHRATARNARHGAATMDTLITLGVAAAYLWSVGVMIWTDAGALGYRMHGAFTHGSGTDIFLEVATTIVALILLGRHLEHRATRRAGRAIADLAGAVSAEATVLRDGREATVSRSELRVDDRIVVRPGERVATDGVVEDGRSAVDRALLTGESEPVPVGPGDAVLGGAINADGRLIVRATRVGAHTALAQITRMVHEAQTGKAPIQRLADRVSAVFVPIVVAVAAVTLVAWLAAGRSAAFAVSAAVAVLVVACPCALGLATPTALMAGTGRGARLGILIRGPQILERAHAVDTVVLDKTGTITAGAMTVTQVVPCDGVGHDELLRAAGGVEAASEHPIGRAIAAAARAAAGPLPPVADFAATPGVGVRGTVEGATVEVVRGDGGVEVRRDGSPLGLVVLRDEVKPGSRAAVAALHALGLRTTMLTGDHRDTADRVAAEVGIEDVVAEVLPEDKAGAVRELQRAGRRVAMIGDGVNDAPALAQADLGIAMGTGTDVAMSAGDVTLVRAELSAAVDAIRLARRTFATIKGNLFWAFAYNVAAIPLAASGRLNPMIAAAAMACSSIFVVMNSLRLRRFTPTGPAGTPG